MQVVIDIPKYVYDTIIACDGYISDCDNEKVGNAIKKGTLLPKGHGRLIDADRLLKEHGDDIANWEKPFGVQNDNIFNAPTIIEADEAENKTDIIKYHCCY